jgi:hypothetical protein
MLKFFSQMILIFTTTAFITTFELKGSYFKKHIRTFENPRYLEEVDNRTANVEIIYSYNNLGNKTENELEKFHKAISLIEYEGTWTNSTSQNDLFEQTSGLIKLQIIVSNISRNGKDLQLRFTINDGVYKDRWFVIEQEYLYFNISGADSDIYYNITESEVTMTDAAVGKYRSTLIQAYNLFNYYGRYSNFYF